MKMYKAIAVIIISMLAISAAEARFPRGAANSSVGKAVLNLGFNEVTAQATTNLFSVATMAPSNIADIANLDADGYPIANLSGNIGGQIGPFSQTLSTTGPWKFSWPAGRSCFSMLINGGPTITASNLVNASVSANPTFNLSVTGDCAHAGSVTLNFSGTLTLAATFLASYTSPGYSGNTGGTMALCRSANTPVDDCTKLANGVYWTSEFVSIIGKTNAIRPMGWNVLTACGQTCTNVVNWGYRKSKNSFSFFGNDDYPPGARCGGTTSFCTISVSGGALTSAAAADTSLAGWVDGEQIVGNVASTVPALSITGVGSNGGKCQITTSSTAGMVSSQLVATNNIGGATECNSLHTTVLSIDSATQFTINVAKGIQTVTSLSGNSVCMGSMPFSTNQQVAFSNIGSITGITVNTTYFAVSISGNCMGVSLSSGGGAVTLGGSAGGAVIGVAYTTGGQVGYQTLAITGKTGGPKLIFGIYAFPLDGGGGVTTLTSGIGAFTYNSVLDAVLYLAGGVANGPPLEAQVQLANLVNANFWYNFPGWANNNFITSASSLIYSNLNSTLQFKPEYSNEIWNGGFPVSAWSYAMGSALGIATNGDATAFQSLRIRQINGTLIPASSWSAAMSRVKRLYCFQGGQGGNGAVTQLVGTNLVSPGTAAYQAYVGGSAVNYNTSPNRPIDFTESICTAPYVGGGTIFSGQSPDTPYAPTSFDAATLNGIVTNYNAGGSGITTAIATIDAAIRGDLSNRVQTVTGSGTTFTTPLAHNLSQYDVVRFTASGGSGYSGLNLLSAYQILTVPTSTTFTVGQILNGSATAAISAGSASGTTSVGYHANGFAFGGNVQQNIFDIMSGWYTKYQNIAVNGFSPAPATGAAPQVEWYEGALEPTAPSTAQCTAIGINSTDCATLATALVAWKNDPMAAATTLYYLQTFTGAAAGTITTGAMSKSAYPAWLVLMGGGPWSLVSNYSFISPAAYQTYNGFATFNANWLLKRDLDPASNDNDPMWLEKAA